VFLYEKCLKPIYCVNDNFVRTYTRSSLVVTVGRHVIPWNPYGPSQTCGQSARHAACSHVKAHRLDQGASADHLERRERVPFTRREKPKTRLSPRTQERMVAYQLVFYKTLIESSLQINTLE
jgi:hypothetical protein